MLPTARAEEAETGWLILGGLVDSELATDTEAAIIEALARRAATADTEDEPEGATNDRDSQ